MPSPYIDAQIIFLTRSDDFSRLDAENDWSRYYRLKIIFWKAIVLLRVLKKQNGYVMISLPYYVLLIALPDFVCRGKTIPYL